MRFHRPRRLSSIALAVSALVLSLFVVNGHGVRPAAAWPTLPCNADHLNQGYLETINSEGDYILWICAYGPIFKYFWKVDSLGNLNEDLNQFKKNAVKFVADGVWQGLVQGGLALLSEGSQYVGNTDFVGTFELHDWSGKPVSRTMAIQMIAFHSTSGTGYHPCTDTGWKQASTKTYRYQFDWSWLGNPKCGYGYYKLDVRGRFVSAVSGSWVTTGWVHVERIYIPAL